MASANPVYFANIVNTIGAKMQLLDIRIKYAENTHNKWVLKISGWKGSAVGTDPKLHIYGGHPSRNQHLSAPAHKYGDEIISEIKQLPFPPR